ncbi:HK97-gp10 family putative phage morphogenesis protein [Brevundimonas sp. UBA5866]|uniref:HK97-gp10 family putative phage morphogenesis protein n=1 Tax=Brevundimonas sp. UBA5866 TaxID=1946132 RepID=UPI0025C42B23|nr:HK97-gp10 family putative phage morphogenesis protein [Brevundimonas sp. UBA5866]
MAFTNRDRLRRKLKAIPVEVRKAVRDQMRANGHDLAEMQRRLVPIDEMDLHNSIRTQDVSTSTRISIRNSVGGKRAHYARWVEFGTASRAAIPARPSKRMRRTGVMTKAKAAHFGMTARPFFWPSYRALKRPMKRRVSAAARKAIRRITK